MPLGGGVCEAGPGVVAGGGVADAGGVTLDGGIVVLGLVVLGVVVLGLVALGLLIAPGVVLPGVLVLSGGQFALALLALGLTPEAVTAWLRSVAVPVVVPGTQGLISGTEPGVDEAPGVAVGAVPGTVVPDVVPDVPVFVPRLPGALVAWASANPASARLKVTIKSNFRMRCFSPLVFVFSIGRAKALQFACPVMVDHRVMGCRRVMLGEKRQDGWISGEIDCCPGLLSGDAAVALRAKRNRVLSHTGQKRLRI